MTFWAFAFADYEGHASHRSDTFQPLLVPQRWSVRTATKRASITAVLVRRRLIWPKTPGLQRERHATRV